MKVLGLDYGTKRIGMAIADLGFPIATSYGTMNNDDLVIDKILGVMRKEEVATLVIGSPKQLSGASSDMDKKAREFGTRLAEISKVTVDYIDERLSSREAERNIGTRSREKIDAEAARIILQAYLDRLAYKDEQKSKTVCSNSLL